MGKKNDNTLVKNASFLMVAALISKIIGMLYKSPLSTTLGSQSFALFQFAQNVYFILLMIASFSIPQAVSKIMAEKIAFHRYKDAQKVFYGALIYAAVAGGIVAFVCVFGARILVPDSMANARLALQMLAPTIFMSGLCGVFRGYFQAYRNMMPTSISQIIEQIFVATFALLMSHVFIQHFSATGDMDLVHRWGAAGATMGTGAGVASALIFMLIVYGVNRKIIRKRIANDHHSVNESMGHVMSNIVLIIMPIILSAFIYNVNGYINSYMYSGIMDIKGAAKNVIQTLYSEYGYYMTLINIPLTLASTAPTSMIPEVSALYATGDIEATRECIDQTVQLSMVVSAPCAMGLAVLAQPIVFLLYGNSTGLAANLLILGSFSILLNGMSNISNGVLQAIGQQRIPVITAAIALVVDIVVVVVLLFTTNLGVYALLIAMVIYSVVVCVLNDRAMKKYLQYKNPWKEGYLYPVLASVPMGIVAGCICYGLNIFVKSNFICLIVSIPVAAVVYLFAYLIISKPSESQLRRIPGGSYLIRIAEKLPFWQNN